MNRALVMDLAFDRLATACRRGPASSALAVVVLLAMCGSAPAVELTSASYRITTHIADGSAAQVDAVNASVESANYRSQHMVGQATGSRDQQLSSASYRVSSGHVFTFWGLGTTTNVWIGANDVGAETSTTWNNAYNWPYGVPTSTARDVVIGGGTGTEQNYWTPRAYPAGVNADSSARDFTIFGDASLPVSAIVTITVAGDWTNNGTFTATNGTVQFTGSTPQDFLGTPVGETFFNLTMAKSAGILRLARGITAAPATLTISNDLSLSGTGGTFYPNNTSQDNNTISVGQDLLLSGSAEFQFNNNGATADVGRHVTITGGILTMNSASDTIRLEGNWDSAAGGTFSAGVGAGDVYFDGTTAAQTISMAAGQSFPTLRISNSSVTDTVTALTNVAVGDDLYITDGIYVVGGLTTTVADRLVGQVNGTLRMNNAADIVDVNGNLDWQGGATEDISTGTLRVAGNFNLTAAASNFTPTGGVVELDGALASAISNSGTLTFYDLTVNKSAAVSVTTTASFDILGDFALQGTGSFNATAGTITFNGSADQSIQDSSTGSIGFYNLVAASASGYKTWSDASLAISGNFTINADSMFVSMGTTATITVAPTGTTAVNGYLTVGNGTTPANLNNPANTTNLNYAYNANMDITGAVQDYPVAAINLNTYVTYSVYVVSRNINGPGTTDRIYVLDVDGNTKNYYFDVPETYGDLVGTLRWNTEGGDLVGYIGTTTGNLYKLRDTLAAMELFQWVTNPVDVGNEITSPAMMDVASPRNVVFGAVNGSAVEGIHRRLSTTGASTSEAQTNLRVEMRTASINNGGTLYVFCGSSGVGFGDIYRVNLSTPNGPEATRETDPDGVVSTTKVYAGSLYAGDLGGTVYGIDAWSANLATNLFTPVETVSAIRWGMMIILYPTALPPRISFGNDGGLIHVRNRATGAVIGADVPFQADPVAGQAVRSAILQRYVSGNYRMYVGNVNGKAIVLDQGLLEDVTDDPDANVRVATADLGSTWAVGSKEISTISSIYGTTFVMLGTSRGEVYIFPMDPSGW